MKSFRVIHNIDTALAASLLLWCIETARLAFFHHTLFPEHRDFFVFSLCSAALLVIAGTIIALLQRGLSPCARLIARGISAISRRRGYTPRYATLQALSCVIISSPWLAVIAVNLFQGEGIQALGLSSFAPPVVFLLLSALSFGVIRSLFLMHTGTRYPLIRTALYSLAVLLLYTADTYLYVGLYTYLHFTLSLTTFLILQSLLSCFLSRSTTRHSSRSIVLRLLPALLSILILTTMWNNNPVAQSIAYRRSALLKTILSPVSYLADRDTTTALPGTGNDYVVKPPRQHHRFMGVCDDMNCILIVMDAVRADHCSVYGYHRDTTPFLEELAEKCVVFDRYYCQSSTYSKQAMAATFTSHYGELLFGKGDIILPTMASLFLQNGYRTSRLTTRWQSLLGHNLMHIGFQEAIDAPANAKAAVEARAAEEVLGDLLEHIRTTRDRRFFLWVQPESAHAPYTPPARLRKFGSRPVDLYDAEILHLDTLIRQMVEGLEEMGILEKTLLIITADHGEQFREHGGEFHGTTLYNEEMHLPLLISYPGCPAKRISIPTGHCDLLPTCATLCGLQLDFPVAGRDLTPALFDDTSLSPIPLIAYSVRAMQWVLIEDDWKLIHSMQGGYDELYHLATDYGEQHNLVRKRAARAGEMRTFLLQARQAILSTSLNWFLPPEERTRCAEILASSPDPYRRAAAARTMATVENSPDLTPILIRTLSDHHAAPRRAAAWALGRTRGKEVIPALLHHAAHDDDYIVRLACIESLGNLRAVSARPFLATLLTEKGCDLGASRIASQALEKIHQ